VGTDKAHEAERTRVLSDEELGSVLSAVRTPAANGNGANWADFADIVRLLILTGQRRDEIGGLRWGEVDLAKGVIRLGASHQNKRAHEVPLSAPALAILAARRGTALDGAGVFGPKGFSNWSHTKRALNN
jgi:integrase